MGRKLVYTKTYKPALLLYKFEKKGIKYVRVGWTNLLGYKGHLHEKTFSMNEVEKIERIKSKFEQSANNLFKRFYRSVCERFVGRRPIES
jgi:ABC-type antimicrobial peptide transport system ATPase subunit